jgi:tRNA (cmo5U34)-methyltransferase
LVGREAPTDKSRVTNGMDKFSDSQAIAQYAEGPSRLVPGFGDLQRMAMLLLAERVPDDGRVLVIGAGGGLEIKVFAEAHRDWQFDGVDPSAQMLDLARDTLGSLASRAQLHLGPIEVAPLGPFDAATCLLTFHFIKREERLRILGEAHRRLKPGAPFVVAHLSFPQGADDRDLWLSRYVNFAVSSGIPRSDAERARSAISAQLPILAPEEDEELLHAAGFRSVALFYVGFSFRGWVAFSC